jgi:predicted O-methyltransferase YrrM
MTHSLYQTTALPAEPDFTHLNDAEELIRRFPVLEKFLREGFAAIEGWCTPYKAARLFALIKAVRPAICVEIGIYGGKSLLPQALALKDAGHGLIYGIDPWSAQAATATATTHESNGIANDDWWLNLDFAAIKRGFYENMVRQDLTGPTAILETTSELAAPMLPAIDILHIDGSHSEIQAAADARLYLPKVRPGGFIWFDDCDWNSTATAISLLKEAADLIETYIDDDGKGNRAAAYMLFRTR